MGASLSPRNVIANTERIDVVRRLAVSVKLARHRGIHNTAAGMVNNLRWQYSAAGLQHLCEINEP